MIQTGVERAESVAGDDVPVLISGGSLVGLSTALFLGGHGIPSLVVERHPGTAIHPRAALFNQRTIELYRSSASSPTIVEASELEFVQNGAIVSVESLGGREIEYYFRNINEGVEELSPSPRLFITQIGARADSRAAGREALGARLEYGTELVSFEVDGDGVTATVEGAGRWARTHACVPDTSSRPTAATAPSESGSGFRFVGHGSVLEQHHDLLPRRRAAAVGRSQPERDLRLRPAPAGVLPLLEGRATPASSSSTRPLDETAALTSDLWTDTCEERCTSSCARRSEHPTCRSRSRTCSAGTRVPNGRRASGTGACSSPATPRTTCPPPAASAATRASRTVTTSRGSSPRARRHRRPGAALDL